MTPHPPRLRVTRREALLCIHGSAAIGRSWVAFTAPLADAFDIAMPDRLGCAATDRWPGGTPATFETEARHLAPLLSARPEGVHLLAHSYGAAVALELALRLPQRVRSLTLYEPARFALLFGDAAAESERNEIVRLGRSVGLLSFSGRLDEAGELFVDYWSGRGAWQGLDARRRQLIASAIPKIAAEFDAAFTDRTPHEHFTRLAMPVRLMRGSASPAPVRRIVDTLASLLPQADVVQVEGAGHMGPLTHADAVRRLLPDWLAPVAIGLAA